VHRPLKSGEAEDSFSFAAELDSNFRGGPLRDAIVHQSADGTLAIRQGAWKLATKLGSHGFSQPKDVEVKPGGPRGQLYDLSSDPTESQNLWLQQPQRVSELETLLNRYVAQGCSRPQNR
jgi:arylsulfatase A